MNNTLTFITVSSRQHNILKIFESIESQKCKELIIKWNIIFDFKDSLIEKNLKEKLISESHWINYRHMPDKRNSIGGGNYGKNLLINEIEEGWIYQIDDDNILYPNFIQEFIVLTQNYPSSNLFCFWQENRYKPMERSDLIAGMVDTAMYIFDKSITNDIQYPIEYGGDGIYLEKLLKNPRTKLWIEHKYLCYYNYLKNNPQESLCIIAQKHGTDKYHRHNYCKAYETILCDYKNKDNISILEVGVLDGASIKMWMEWLPMANVYGIDNWYDTKKEIGINGAIIKNADSKNISVCDILEWKKFDIIIDDGDHHPYAQLITLWNLWPLLNSGGIYIIEDIQNFETYYKHWKFLSNIELIDMRKDSGTYDSILFCLKKI